jgi:uncharacterized protein
MPSPVTPLEKHQTFCFTCSPQVPCFNACCRNLTQVLTPYDVLCLTRYLKMSSGVFLDRYTVESTGPETGLPVVSLRFREADGLACPFVSDAGCRVYAARPSSCRTYPLARGVSRNRRTGQITEQWALIREPHCLGFDGGAPRTADQWVNDQQMEVYQRMNDRMLQLISKKNQFRPGPLKPGESKQVYTALYDLDTFRETLMQPKAGSAGSTGAAPLAPANADDTDLLLMAMDWVAQNVFTPTQRNSAI